MSEAEVNSTDLEVVTKVSPEQLKNSLEWSINYLLNADQSFIGYVLQCLTIRYSNHIPTAGIFFNKKTRVFEMLINPDYFCNKLDRLQRVAVLKHEIYHVTHAHVFFDAEKLAWDKMLTNVAMDMSINQVIKNLPEGTVDYNNFRDKDKNPFPPNKPMEVYYELMYDGGEVLKQSQKGDGQGVGEGSGEEGSSNTEQPSANGGGSGGGQWVKCTDAFNSPESKGGDVHGWEDADVDIEEKLRATADLVRRAKTKSSNSYSASTKALDDILDLIESKIKELDYRAILMSALRKSLPARFSRRTWAKHSRRYGEDAKGKLKAKLPRLELFIDTSGSISMEEANEFLDIVRNFLTLGVDKAYVNMFHTSNYFRKEMRKDFKINPEDFQSGGTDLQDSFDTLGKARCDLAIWLTDGHWSMPDLPKSLPTQVFIISKGGTVDHPLKDKGKTIQYKW